MTAMSMIPEMDDWPLRLGEADQVTLVRPLGDNVLKVWPVSTVLNSPME